MPHFFLFNQLTNKLVFAILYLVLNNYAALAQLVERFHGKEEVVGSSPTGGSSKNVEFSTFFFVFRTTFNSCKVEADKCQT